VQGYLYAAKVEMAPLYERAGDAARARQLAAEASALKDKFNRDFWMEERGFYAMALQNDGRPVRSISSNPGHALWCGLIDAGRAKKVVDRLMQSDMYNGWGIRTLGQNEKGYNPIGYHLGTVWPHDNAIIAAGLRRYGFVEEAGKIFSDLLSAAMDFGQARLPELFTGFSRDDFAIPVHYPIACHPQAWAAGAIPFLLQTSLGLEADAFARRLKISRPVLPEFVPNIEIEGLRVGSAQVDLRFERSGRRFVTARVLRVQGPLDVVIEPAEARA
jgi:glycogen debranching enzyme